MPATQYRQAEIGNSFGQVVDDLNEARALSWVDVEHGGLRKTDEGSKPDHPDQRLCLPRLRVPVEHNGTIPTCQSS
ncbi:hypothetical protein OG394_16160 [Kribbella sp. NBC_01245]|uniref:hypothetical protein n=1 Tax=Kribbella sp. NBC_01245 TaxID=2903578 RepID=UPI002E2ACA69|nr:hypothetical protein [Kribbella sp. NBC_01245]